MARASHLAFAIQGGLQGDFGDLDIKYLKKNISKCRSHISGSFRRTPRHCAKWLRNSPGKRYQRIRICLTGEVETPSSTIRRQAPDVKYLEKVERRKGDRLRVHGVGTPPPDDTESASLSGATPSGFPKRTCGALPYPDSLREKHTTLAIITPRPIAYPIRICCPDH
uniref:Uncharacterized protein n=1 Tax=Vitis vinifera TaxID=29760 RepID=A5BHG6_VITVI|nr:hypothetical protein VITISV_022932 [Vitis vinifera]